MKLKRVTGVPKSAFADLQQVETATAAGTITQAGNATVVVTAADVSGTPVTLSVAVALNDTATLWAAKVRTALAANAAISAEYLVSGSTTSIVLTRKVLGLHDDTLNISLDNGTCTGITTAATSVNTTAGLKNAASESAPGVVELATTAEINTGTDAEKPMCPDQFQASNRNIRYLVWRVVAQATSLSAAEATILGAMPVPFSGVIQTPIAYVDTEGTTGNATYDIHYGADPAVAATIMSSTKITIATAQNVSTAGGATQPVLTTTAAVAGNFFTFHCDAVQSGTAAKGLTFVIPILET